MVDEFPFDILVNLQKTQYVQQKHSSVCTRCIGVVAAFDPLICSYTDIW